MEQKGHPDCGIVFELSELPWIPGALSGRNAGKIVRITAGDEKVPFAGMVCSWIGVGMKGSHYVA
jgi:hypothetical protein